MSLFLKDSLLWLLPNLRKTFNDLYKVIKVLEISSARSYYNEDFSFLEDLMELCRTISLSQLLKVFIFFICVLYFHVIKNRRVMLFYFLVNWNLIINIIYFRLELVCILNTLLYCKCFQQGYWLSFLLCLCSGMVILIKIVHSLV